MRLSGATAALLPAWVERPGYDRDAQRCGIVHLGIGAFGRAHQAVYTDAAMVAGDRDWAITGVSLRGRGAAAALLPQDRLYTVTRREPGAERCSLIGAVRDVVVAPEAPGAVVAALAATDTRVVTLTVTEKGYHLSPDGLLDLPVERAGGGTIYHFLGAAFAQRAAAGLPGLTLISCDNLPDNGSRLAAALEVFLDRHRPALTDWFARECACPATVVDRIVPAATTASLDAMAARLTMRDEAAIVTESFGQWMIEDRFAGERPRWETGGACVVDDVRPFALAKLRMLNGAHSALAYLGLPAGHSFVHEALADPAIRPIVDRLVRIEAAACLPIDGRALETYADALFARFGNAALQHRLDQIAMDGSQKVPQRWLASLEDNRLQGRRCPATLTALAAWLLHVRGDRDPVHDPRSDALAALWAGAGSADVAAAVFGEGGMLAGVWQPKRDDLAALSAAIEQQNALVRQRR